MKLHVTTGDTVRVMRGDDKGKVGKVLRVYRKTGRVVVEGVNIVKRHRKARTAEEQSGIIEFAGADPRVERDAARPEVGRRRRGRGGASTTDGTKERLSVKSGEAIPRVR